MDRLYKEEEGVVVVDVVAAPHSGRCLPLLVFILLVCLMFFFTADRSGDTPPLTKSEDRPTTPQNKTKKQKKNVPGDPPASYRPLMALIFEEIIALRKKNE